MKRTIQGFLFLSLFALLQAGTARADVTRVRGGLSCRGVHPFSTECLPTEAVRVRQGRTTVLYVKGQDVNAADHNDVGVSGSGVSAKIIKDHFIAPGEGLGTGQADVELNVSANATPGERTVTLKHKGCFGCPKNYTFKIRVLRNGRITSVDVPSPADFFQEVNITFHGENIGSPLIVVATANPAGTTASVVSNLSNESTATVRLRFPDLRAEGSATLTLSEENCSGCPVYLNNNAGDNTKTAVTVSSRANFVQSITFPDGNSVTPGSVLTIQVNLAHPAGAPLRKRPSVVEIFPRPGPDVLHWQLVPSNVFAAAPGSGISFSPTGLNQVRFNTGDTLVRLRVLLSSVPAGCSQQCTAKIETRMGNINSDQPPFFKSATFTIVQQ